MLASHPTPAFFSRTSPFPLAFSKCASATQLGLSNCLNLRIRSNDLWLPLSRSPCLSPTCPAKSQWLELHGHRVHTSSVCLLLPQALDRLGLPIGLVPLFISVFIAVLAPELARFVHQAVTDTPCILFYLRLNLAAWSLRAVHAQFALLA